MRIPSVWDHWKTQCRYSYATAVPGADPMAYCAIGWLMYVPESRNTVRAAIERVGGYLLRTVTSDHTDWVTIPDLPLEDRYEAAVMFANDVLRWTPAKFRKMDRELQVEEAVLPLVDEPVEVLV